MSVIRRSMIACFLAAAMPMAAIADDMRTPPFTDDELVMISVMQQRGTPDFVMLNEKQGLIKLIRNGRVELASPAASGAVKGDDASVNPRVTPAGIFPLRDFNDNKYIQYYRSGQDAYMIHPTTPNRDRLLAEKKPERFRASEGCIAVPRPVFKAIREFLSHEAKPVLVVLPEEQSVRSLLGMSPK